MLPCFCDKYLPTSALCGIKPIVAVTLILSIFTVNFVMLSCVMKKKKGIHVHRKLSKLFGVGSKFGNFETEALEVHNEYRKEHGVPPLTLNKEMCKVSQKWAEELAKNDSMAYSLNQKYGESVYCGWSSDPKTVIKARDCVSKWYNEINEYSFGKEPEVLTCGHFTQIVWKDTKELGIGNAKSKSGKLYVVANYFPPGNYSGHFAQNVLPPGAGQFKSNKGLKSSSAVTSPRGCMVDDSSQQDLSDRLRSAKIDKFEEDFLNTHNTYRRKHGVLPLIMNNKLSKYAQEWANELARRNKMEHRDQEDYGENIYTAWSNDPNFVVSGREPVDKWYDEIKEHKFGKEPKNMRTGHFTQIVWEDTRELGVGRATSKDGHVYVVANYCPPGNIIGDFSRKVPPPVKK